MYLLRCRVARLHSALIVVATLAAGCSSENATEPDSEELAAGASAIVQPEQSSQTDTSVEAAAAPAAVTLVTANTDSADVVVSASELTVEAESGDTDTGVDEQPSVGAAVSGEPEPAEAQPEPETAEAPSEPEPAETQPEPETAEPLPEPETAEAAEPEPEIAEPQPEPETVEAAEPEPETAEAQPEPGAPEAPSDPAAPQPDPVEAPAEPEPAEADPEPEAAAAQPEPTDDRTEIIVGSNPGDAQCLRLPAASAGFGQVDDGDWSDWIDGVRWAIGSEHLALTGDNSGERSLRQQYVPSSNGSTRVVVATTLPEHRTYRLVQSLLFEENFDWGGVSEGGKVGFGLSGGTSPTGGKVDPAGFSARLMWRGNNNNGTARVVLYSYAADRPGTYGQSINIGEFQIPVGEWFDIAMEVTVNSSTGASDGSARAWINGELSLERTGIAWQTAGGAPSIDNMYFSSFYGGNNSAWSPDYTTHAQFRDVCWAPVVDGYSGIDPEAGRLDAPSQESLERPVFNDPSVVLAQDRINSQIESNILALESMLDLELPVVGEYFEEAALAMRQARAQSHWITSEMLDHEAATLLGLDEALEWLHLAQVARQATDGEFEFEASRIASLSSIAVELVDRLVEQATNVVSGADCTGAYEASCVFASDELASAIDYRQQMTIMTSSQPAYVQAASGAWDAAARAIALSAP